jgi:histone-lysine N-methyltransferase SETMAR
MAVIPHPPFSPDLSPCDFVLFTKIKLKLKGRRFDTTEEIQAESQRMLDTLTEKDFQVREGTTSREMAADRPSGEF